MTSSIPWTLWNPNKEWLIKGSFFISTFCYYLKIIVSHYLKYVDNDLTGHKIVDHKKVLKSLCCIELRMPTFSWKQSLLSEILQCITDVEVCSWIILQVVNAFRRHDRSTIRTIFNPCLIYKLPKLHILWRRFIINRVYIKWTKFCGDSWLLRSSDKPWISNPITRALYTRMTDRCKKRVKNGQGFKNQNLRMLNSCICIKLTSISFPMTCFYIT